MSDSKIGLKSVRELLSDGNNKPANYWIPDYQRGYRWTPLMVTQLLDDIWEFIQSTNSGKFYCLQPIVIKTSKDGRYEVVDGQQRLTTIYIILTCLQDLLQGVSAERFTLTFETRDKENASFLATIDERRDEENSNFFHMCGAKKAVRDWFSGDRAKFKIKFLEHLLNTEELRPNVQVIWFELDAGEKAVDAYIRLNDGKILLTDDELIRALFLRRDSPNDREVEARQRRIAHEWDQIEKDLQVNAFWYFLTDRDAPNQNRIGFLLELVASSEGIPPEFKSERNKVFLTFNKKLSPKNADQEAEWSKVKEQFMRLQEWYDDRLLFHLIGFLLRQSIGLVEINNMAKGCSKSGFYLKLRQRIFTVVIDKSSPDPVTMAAVREKVTAMLSNLDYENNKQGILPALLLFNIATLHENRNSNLRFQFDNFKTQKWNIEHIRAIASDPPESHSDRVKWFELCSQYLRSREEEVIGEEASEIEREDERKRSVLLGRIEDFKTLSKEMSDSRFESLYKDLFGYFREDPNAEPDHSIANLALLDEGTNKGYGNAPFAVKRDWLLTRDQEGLFIPLCTRNVFLKCYNRKANNLMFWSTQDRDSYFKKMVQTISNFLSESENPCLSGSHPHPQPKLILVAGAGSGVIATTCSNPVRQPDRHAKIMNEVGKKMTISELILTSCRIQIPMIQRDYAQGRYTASDIRKQFLDALEGALNPTGVTSVPLNLDFVYGSMEGEQQKFFAPLDGQQRLTTLFLLHWYLAWVDEQWEPFFTIFKDGNKSRFSYDVRPSSQDFFNYLVRSIPDCRPIEVDCLSELIRDQSWYLRYFDLDPTIQSALVMLNELHGRFKTSSGLYARLLDPNTPAITFQVLKLHDFGLSDDLYIKMNARGKALTPYESFKAKYEDKLEAIFQGETRPLGESYLKIKEFVSLRLDTTWANFFWNYRDPVTHDYDDAIMNLFRLLALITREPDSEEFISDAISLSNIITPPAYAVFEQQQWLDRGFTEMLIALMERWTIENNHIKPLLPSDIYFAEIRMFERTIRRNSELNSELFVWEIIQLAGYAFFIRQYDQGTLEPEIFQEWMRIVRNLTVNSTLDRTTLPDAMRGLAEILPHRETILEYFAILPVKSRITGFGLQAVQEEILKAGLILNHPGWRELIDEAEAHPYFKGQIGFLCDFCGATAQWKETSSFEWGDTQHEEFQGRFRDYLLKAQMMFNHEGLVDIGDNRWERALLITGDYLLSSKRNYSFLVNPATHPVSWKRLLRGGKEIEEKRKFVKDLWDKLSASDPVVQQLNEIIARAKWLKPWIEAFVHTPHAMEYCSSQLIRWNSETEIYLLKKCQMNGYHAELFTYSLYHEVLLPLEAAGDLNPLELSEYCQVKASGEHPCIPIIFPRGSCNLCFTVEFKIGIYHIKIMRSLLEPFPELYDLLCRAGGFTEVDQFISRTAAPNAIKDSLTELARLLASLTESRS